MALRYSSLYARNLTSSIVLGAVQDASQFIYNGPTATRVGDTVVLSGTYVPGTNGNTTFNAGPTLTDSLVVADIPFGARLLRTTFIPAADMTSGGTSAMNVGFGLVTPAGVVTVTGGVNPTVETVYANSLTTGGLITPGAGFGDNGVVDVTTTVLGLLPVATRPAGRQADFYQLIVAPTTAAGSLNASSVRFNIEYVFGQ